MSTGEPDSLISPDFSEQIDRDSLEAIWEEIETIISKDSNVTSILLLLVSASDILAAIGIATNAIHITIAGMLVAPGFIPIMRIALGLAAKSSAVAKRGLIDMFLGYLVLIVGAALTAVIMQAFGMNPLYEEEDYYQVTDTLFAYWTTVTPTSIAASAAASLAGAVLISTKRSIFASDVMIGLALVPSAAIIGMALVTGDTASAGQAASRWGIDVMLIITISYLFFAVMRALQHKRDIAM